jgi:beta-1,4-N-acetylglucosaminyltransferase
VGQSYTTAVVSTARGFASSASLLMRERPSLLLVNGPGTCLPVAVLAVALSRLGLVPRCRVVFVESVCRVTTLSLTGKLLYRVADRVLVQWPELAER